MDARETSPPPLPEDEEAADAAALAKAKPWDKEVKSRPGRDRCVRPEFGWKVRGRAGTVELLILLMYTAPDGGPDPNPLLPGVVCVTILSSFQRRCLQSSKPTAACPTHFPTRSSSAEKKGPTLQSPTPIHPSPSVLCTPSKVVSTGRAGHVHEIGPHPIINLGVPGSTRGTGMLLTIAAENAVQVTIGVCCPTHLSRSPMVGFP